MPVLITSECAVCNCSWALQFPCTSDAVKKSQLVTRTAWGKNMQTASCILVVYTSEQSSQIRGALWRNKDRLEVQLCPQAQCALFQGALVSVMMRLSVIL